MPSTEEAKQFFMDCISVEPIPVDKKEFTAFCDRNGIHELGGERRGWWPRLNTYIRDANFVIRCDGSPIEIFNITDRDVKEWTNDRIRERLAGIYG